MVYMVYYPQSDEMLLTRTEAKRVHNMTKRAMTLVVILLVCVPGLSSAQAQEPVDAASQFRQIARELAGAGSKLETISKASCVPNSIRGLTISLLLIQSFERSFLFAIILRYSSTLKHKTSLDRNKYF